MENTLLIGLSKQVALERQLAVIANNVANVNTTGFKSEKPVFEEFLMPVANAGEFTGRDRTLSYVQDRATWHDLAQGGVEQTNNPLDVALDGKGFLVVQAPGGERYTRNGALLINAQGQLVTNEGYPVVGDNGPITFQPGDQNIHIAKDGSITVREGNNAQADSTRGKMRIVEFDQPQRLVKQGSSLFSAPNGVTATPSIEAGIRQGFVEKSNVVAVAEMSRMIEVMRSYTNIATMLQQQGDARKTAIERLADVPA
jgi:flagellar basal-body rod protein FlgF/flagellar basal-body rod protein FlgG